MLLLLFDLIFWIDSIESSFTSWIWQIQDTVQLIYLLLPIFIGSVSCHPVLESLKVRHEITKLCGCLDLLQSYSCFLRIFLTSVVPFLEINYLCSTMTIVPSMILHDSNHSLIRGFNMIQYRILEILST